MKAAIVFPFHKMVDPLGDTDGLPISTPMLVGNVKDLFPQVAFAQIDLNWEIRTLVKRGKFPGERYAKTFKYVESLIAKRRGLDKAGGTDKPLDAYSDNRLAQDYYIPDKTDLLAVADALDEMCELLGVYDFDHYFLTVYKSDEVDVVSSLLLAMHLKTRMPHKKVILGGFGAIGYNLAENIKKLKYVDSIVLDWGENSFKEILNKLLAGEKPAGSYKLPVSGRDLLRGRPDYQTFRNLDYFRPSAGEILSRYHTGLECRKTRGVLLLPYEFSIGCFWNRCKYCGSTSYYSGLHLKSADRIVEDLERMRDSYDTNTFIFYNQDFNQSLGSAKKILSKMISRKLKILWTDSFNLVNLDGELIDMLAEAGCFRMGIGVSILNPRLQQIYENVLRDNKLLDSLVKISKKGIWVDINIIANMPYDWTAKDDIAILAPYIPYIDAVSLNNFRVYHNLDLVENPAKYHLKVVDTVVKVGQKTAPMYFIEDNFIGTLETRKKMFAANFTDWDNFIRENDMVCNLKNYHLLALLYNELGHKNKKKIKNLVLDSRGTRI